MRMIKKVLRLVLIGSMMLTANIANATTAIDIISRFGPTSANGILALEYIRLLNEAQTEYEFRLKTIPGAQGESADQRLLALAKDGQKVLWYGPISAFTVNRFIIGNTYDRDRDIVPLQSIFGVPFSVMVNEQSPIKTLDQLMEKLKTKGGFVATTTGGVNDVLNNILLIKHNVQNIKPLNYVTPFDLKRSVLTGESDYTVFPHPDMAGLRMLVVSSKAQLPEYPTVPTGIEMGMSEFEYTSLNMISAPKESAEFGKSLVPLLNNVCNSTKMKTITNTAGYQNLCLGNNEIASQISSEIKLMERHKDVLIPK